MDAERENVQPEECLTPVTSKYQPVVGLYGIGGAGGNMVFKYMSKHKREENPDVLVRAINTDAKIMDALFDTKKNPFIGDWSVGETFKRIQIGEELTKGAGAGADPKIGEMAAKSDESKKIIQEDLARVNMPAFVLGLGGGTGTGAGPVIAKYAKDNLAKVAIAVMPALNEGTLRRKRAQAGLKKLLTQAPTFILRNEFLKDYIVKNYSSTERNKITREQGWDVMNGVTVEEIVATTQQVFQMTGTTVNMDEADWRTSFGCGRYPLAGLLKMKPEDAEKLKPADIADRLMAAKFQDKGLIERGKVMIVSINGPWGTLITDEAIEIIQKRICAGNAEKKANFELFLGDSSELWHGNMAISLVIVADGPVDEDFDREEVAANSVSVPDPMLEEIQQEMIQSLPASIPAIPSLPEISQATASNTVDPEKKVERAPTAITFKSNGVQFTRMVNPELAQKFGQAHANCKQKDELEAVNKEVEEATGKRPDLPDRFDEKPQQRGLLAALGFQRSLKPDGSGSVS